MAGSIATSIIACLKSFNEFIAEIKSVPSHEAGDLGLVPAAWEDELGRLRMWAANIGAHQTAQSSLDFRLRDSSHIREQIVKLLQDLLQRLQDTRDVLAEGEKAADNDEFADHASDDGEPTTEIQELRESVATIVNCLFQMSMLVRKPAHHDMMMGSRRTEVAMFEPFDYNHVRDKYPGADNPIIERLGLAITRRRKYLKYRERHALKLKQGINKVIPEPRSIKGIHEGETAAEGTVSLLSDTIATDIKEPNIHFDDDASDSGVSQTSYAQTLLGGGDITIPRPPKSAQGGSPFECPYCHFLITTKRTRSWNRHVFQDLQPYICVANTCATPDKLYSTRHEWLHHSKTIHPADFSLRPEKEVTAPSLMCPLCREKVHTEQQYDRHVARHLQELALFILPRTDEDSDADEGGSGSGSGCESDAESDTSEDLLKSRDPPRKRLEVCNNLLVERYVPDCQKLLEEGVFGNYARYRGLRDDLEELVSTMQALDLENDRDMEDWRTRLVNIAKSWLNILDNQSENASLKIPRSSASGSDDDKEHMSDADVEQQKELFFCPICKRAWNRDQGAVYGFQCPNCHSDLVEIVGPSDPVAQMSMANPDRHSPSPETLAEDTEKSAKTAEVPLAQRVKQKPIKFEDAVGRKFSFPFHLCSTWPVSYSNSSRELPCVRSDFHY